MYYLDLTYDGDGVVDTLMNSQLTQPNNMIPMVMVMAIIKMG